MTFKTLLRAGLAALAVLAARPVFATTIFGFADVAVQSVPAREAPRHHRAARPNHARVRFTLHAPGAEASAGSGPLLAVARRYLGRGNFTGYREAWCADAVNVWLRRAGLQPQRSHRAVDFARYGRAARPHVGAIAVLRHHVGIVAGFSRGRVILLSGNHGHRVGLGAYAAHRIIAFRDPV
jgi:uncharacterized protein (TIGR02594 family)